PAGLQAADGANTQVCLLPVVVRGKVVAALYSDGGENPASEQTAALEIISRVAGLSLETAATRAAAGRATSQTSVAAEAAAEPEALAATPAVETPAAPTPINDLAAAGGSFAQSFPVAPQAASDLSSLPNVDVLPELDRESHRKAH